MFYFLAFLPILLILVLMAGFHWSGQKAGPAGWAAGARVVPRVFPLRRNQSDSSESKIGSR